MHRRRNAAAALIAVAGFAALFAVLPSKGAGKKVVLSGFRFHPGVIQVAVGGAVTFENKSKVTHTATCEGCPQDTGDIQPGLLKTLTFTRAGSYRLFCIYHGSQGMVARLTVGAAASPRAPTASSPTPPPSPSPTETSSPTPTSSP